MLGFPARAPADEEQPDIVVGISADLTITQVRLALDFGHPGDELLPSSYSSGAHAPATLPEETP